MNETVSTSSAKDNRIKPNTLPPLRPTMLGAFIGGLCVGLIISATLTTLTLVVVKMCAL